MYILDIAFEKVGVAHHYYPYRPSGIIHFALRFNSRASYASTIYTVRDFSN